MLRKFTFWTSGDVLYAFLTLGYRIVAYMYIQWRNFRFWLPVRKSKPFPRVKLFCFETFYIGLLLFVTWFTNDTN